jgi:hypothetical protein
MDKYEKLKTNVNTEFENFKNKMLKESKEEIFDNAYKIRFYTNVWDYIQYLNKDTFLEEAYIECLLQDFQSVLTCLWDYFLKQEYASVETYDDTQDLIENYCEKYYKEVVKNGRF